MPFYDDLSNVLSLSVEVLFTWSFHWGKCLESEVYGLDYAMFGFQGDEEERKIIMKESGKKMIIMKESGKKM